MSDMKKESLLMLVLMSLLGNQAMRAGTTTEGDTEVAGYRQFVEDDKQWLVVSNMYGFWYIKLFYSDGDTIISERPCKKVMLRYEDDNSSATSLYCCVFEENERVYYYPAENGPSTSPMLLYDFTVTPGDTIRLGGERKGVHNEALYQVWKDLLLENREGKFHGMLATEYDPELTYVDENSRLPLYEWYEGIGNIFSPFRKKPWGKEMGGLNEFVYECRSSGRVIYHTSYAVYDEDRVLRMWNGIDGIKDTLQREGCRYAIDGKQIKGTSPKGVYIVNGKKYIYR